MRSFWRDLLTAVLIGLVLPGCLLRIAVHFTESGNAPPAETAAQETAPETIAESVALPMLLRQADGSVEPMDMDSYLVGVVLAEMPTAFEAEALKAQAVVARTYTQKAYETGGKHGDGSVCADPACCQAYIAPGDYLAQGGTAQGLEKVAAAVAATTGYVLTYQGELIEATYFSCSGGSTEEAAAVWGTDYPYLQAVDSPGEENAVHYTDTLLFTAQEFQEALGHSLSGSAASWFGAVTYTAGGGVATMVIDGVSYTGSQLRSLLGLPSTAFAIAVDGEQVHVTTRGYGHRVGMSQYGADAMAVTGSSYQEILAYYYQGTALTWLG